MKNIKRYSIIAALFAMGVMGIVLAILLLNSNSTVTANADAKILNTEISSFQLEDDVELCSYSIKYYVDDWKGNSNPNPVTYNSSQQVEFEKLECEGYSFEWKPAGIPVGTEGDITVKGIWTPLTYNIFYNLDGDLKNKSKIFAVNGQDESYKKILEKRITNTELNNPLTYTYGEKLDLVPAECNGYNITWDIKTIPVGTIGDVVVTATYEDKSLNECYNNGVYEIWTESQLKELRQQPNGGSGRTYRLMDDIYYPDIYSPLNLLSPIPEFKGTFDGANHSITQYQLDISSGSNFGFCAINSGVIKYLTLGIEFRVDSSYSNVNVGSFAGINRGVIIGCSTTPAFNRPYFECYAKGDSYMGCFVGVNEGTISGCYEGDALSGSCNMGTIAGKNAGFIRDCNVESFFPYIDFTYNDYNACIGGIAGIQTEGSIKNCTFTGQINLKYSSSKYNLQKNNWEMQPCMGIIIGRMQGGSVGENTWTKGSSGDPTIIYATTYDVNHNGTIYRQGQYINQGECGRKD